MSKFTAVGLAILALLVPTTAKSQHHHHSGGHSHQPVYHHGSNWGHSNWTHVVPSHQHYGHDHHGSYYSTGHNHYYTPTAVAYVATSNYSPNYSPPPVQAPVQMSFGGFSHCEDLAGRLETDLNNFCLDLHYNYHDNAGYRETYREAYDLLQQAKYVHAKEHQGDRAEIARQVSALDQKFHHVQEDLAAFHRHHHRQIGIGGVVTKGQNIEAVIHHLAYDVGVEPHAEASHQHSAPGGSGAEIAPPPAGTTNGPITSSQPATLP